MNLQRLQQELSVALNTEDGDIPHGLQQRQPLTSAQRLAIYRHSLHSSLQQVLTAVYPVCQKIVGEEFFAAMVTQYRQQMPSRSPDIENYGDSLPVFIRDFAPAACLPYLADVARLEWGWYRASLGQDFTQFTPDSLSQVEEDKQGDIIFQLPPDSTLLTSPYPILRIWEANQENNLNEETIDLTSGGDQLIIYRRGMDVLVQSLTDKQWSLLSGLYAGLSVEQLCVRFAENSQFNLADELAECLRKGWIVHFTFALNDVDV